MTLGEISDKRHATLSFIKIDMRHWGPQSRAPSNSPSPAVTFHLHGSILDRTISHDISKIENNTQSPDSFSLGTRNYSCASRQLYVHIISQVAKNVVASKNRLQPPTKNQSQDKTCHLQSVIVTRKHETSTSLQLTDSV